VIVHTAGLFFDQVMNLENRANRRNHRRRRRWDQQRNQVAVIEAQSGRDGKRFAAA
jgi:hypothetical protein